MTRPFWVYSCGTRDAFGPGVGRDFLAMDEKRVSRAILSRARLGRRGRPPAMPPPLSPADAFFASSPPPASLHETRGSCASFLAHHGHRPGAPGTRPVALVTSGGTTAPLERTAVRFIDNFSSGARGAASAEYLIRAGYAVVFLHREGSLKPFDRALPRIVRGAAEATRCWGDGSVLGLIRDERSDRPPSEEDRSGSSPHRGSTLRFNAGCADAVAAAVAAHRDAAEAGALLCVPFSTVFEYVHSLRALCEELGRHCGERAMAYLAAAVSDFYVPWAELPEHKIQSREAPDDEDREAASGVVLRLRRVPKMLGLVRSRWCPRAFVVGFKLETDPALLYRKASDSLRLYALHAVVANEMATRRDRAWVASLARTDATLGATPGSYQLVERGEDEPDLEERLVDELVERHERHVLLHAGGGAGEGGGASEPRSGAKDES